MKRFLFASIILASTIVHSQEVEVVKFPELQKKILTADAPLTVFNFWATWCGPCVKEIPHFESYSKDENVKVYLVSLDFPDHLDKVKAFVEKKGLKSQILHLHETDYNSYMRKVHKDWSGAIPATLFVDEWGKTSFHEGELTKEQLAEKINSYLN